MLCGQHGYLEDGKHRGTKRERDRKSDLNKTFRGAEETHRLLAAT